MIAAHKESRRRAALAEQPTSSAPSALAQSVHTTQSAPSNAGSPSTSTKNLASGIAGLRERYKGIKRKHDDVAADAPGPDPEIVERRQAMADRIVVITELQNYESEPVVKVDPNSPFDIVAYWNVRRSLCLTLQTIDISSGAAHSISDHLSSSS
jgi:hypothetical protein